MFEHGAIGLIPSLQTLSLPISSLSRSTSLHRVHCGATSWAQKGGSSKSTDLHRICCNVAGCARRRLQACKSPAKKSLMLGSAVMSKLGVVGSPVVITLACATSEVLYKINFWASIAAICRTWNNVSRSSHNVLTDERGVSVAKDSMAWVIVQCIDENLVAWSCAWTRYVLRIIQYAV